jgi:soluble lytic murein transglycosylase-like protein
MQTNARLLPFLLLATVSGLSCSVWTEAPNVVPTTLAEAPPARAGDADLDTVQAHLTRYASHTGLTEAEIQELARTLVAEARSYGLDPRLVLAVMHVESRFYNFAVSPVGAIGLMQVMPATGEELAARLGIRWLGPQTLFEPTTNVRMGVAYLRELSDRYGSLPMALAAYNWGPGRIDRRLRLGAAVPEEYPSLVLEAYAAGRGRS